LILNASLVAYTSNQACTTQRTVPRIRNKCLKNGAGKLNTSIPT